MKRDYQNKKFKSEVKKFYSLKGRNLFRDVHSKGIKIQDRNIRVYFLKFSDYSKKNSLISKDHGNLKFGISLNKKFGKAYKRNKARRRIRNICYMLLKEMNEGFYIILRPEKGFLEIPFEEELLIVRKLFARARMLKNNVD